VVIDDPFDVATATRTVLADPAYRAAAAAARAGREIAEMNTPAARTAEAFRQLCRQIAARLGPQPLALLCLRVEHALPIEPG
jgi:hypothetical protein